MSSKGVSKSPVASSIPFDNNSVNYNSIDVQEALAETRHTNVQSINTVTTTLNGTATLTIDSDTICRMIGTATGYSIVLPDATTLFKGRRYEIVNETTETIELKYDDGTVLLNVIAGDDVVVTLEDDATSNGTWLVIVNSDAATGITSYSVGSDTTFSTTSETDVLITGMTITPVTGRYACWYSSDITIDQNNKLSEVVFYKDGSAVARSRRVSQGVSSNFRTAHQTIAEISVNGSQAIDVRVNISGASSVDINQRRLILIRLGI